MNRNSIYEINLMVINLKQDLEQISADALSQKFFPLCSQDDFGVFILLRCSTFFHDGISYCTIDIKSRNRFR